MPTDVLRESVEKKAVSQLQLMLLNAVNSKVYAMQQVILMFLKIELSVRLKGWTSRVDTFANGRKLGVLDENMEGAYKMSTKP